MLGFEQSQKTSDDDTGLIQAICRLKGHPLKIMRLSRCSTQSLRGNMDDLVRFFIKGISYKYPDGTGAFLI